MAFAKVKLDLRDGRYVIYEGRDTRRILNHIRDIVYVFFAKKKKNKKL